MGCVNSRSQTNETGTNSKVTLDDISKPKDNNNVTKFPDPKPPRKRKKDILPDVSTLKHIDDHVTKTPRYAERSIEKLGEYILRPAKTDIEKIRAIYKWVTENIRYDTDSFFGRKKNAVNDPSSLLLSKSSVCDGYASIFQLLCDYAGIPVMKISGYSKGYSYRPGINISTDKPTNHAWNAVYIHGEWRFIETTWGAGTVGENKQFNKNFTDFYFLTDPELFAVDHFPYFDNDEKQSSKWQLLKKPLSLETFNRRINPSRHAREWGCQFTSHCNAEVEMDKSVDIKFQTKSDNLCEVNVSLFDSSGRNQNQYAVVRKQAGKFTVTVSPPSTGEYRLEIYGTVDSDSNTLQCLVSYLIKCNSIDNDICPFPKFHGFYGAVENWKERGFTNVNKIQFKITSKTGEITLPISIKEGTNVMATLKNSDDVKLLQYTLLEMDKQLTLRARFPEKGYYRLVVFSQFNSDKYLPAISILVHNLKVPVNSSPFPQTYPETTKLKCSLVEPLTRDLPANTEVRFRFSSPIITKAMVLREDVPKTKKYWDITVKTPPFGEIRISGKKENESTAWVVYTFKVKSAK